jgi:hypothetical protein
MEININDESQIVDIWMTNAEKLDKTIQEKLKPFYKHFSERKYIVAVFISGVGDLYSSTEKLLLHNKLKLT